MTMVDRITLRTFALSMAAAGLLSACQPTTHHPTPQELAAADAAKQAQTYDTMAEDKIINHPLFPGTAIQPVQPSTGQITEQKSLSPAAVAAMKKAVAMHAMEAAPAPGAKP
jgi:hypothetical protein